MMRRPPAILMIAVAAALAGRYLLSRDGRRIDLSALRRRLMERVMDAMPEDSPPKLINTILPRLKQQNDEILVLLKEQNDLLRRTGPVA